VKAIVDVDDLIHEDQITEYLKPLHAKLTDFKMTVYAVPNRLGPVHKLRLKYPWLTFAIHGWEHTFAECLAWTESEATYHISNALEMGYAPLFKPPNWLFDKELVKACIALNVVLHHHQRDTVQIEGLKTYVGGPNYIHSHIMRNPSTDFITECPGFEIANLKRYKGFMTPMEISE